MLLGIIKKLENNGYKITVIGRNNSYLSKEMFTKEKDFYQKNFDSVNFCEFSEEKKYEFLFKERDNIFITDYSYFGFEALSINNKCLFFSNYLKNYYFKFFNENFIITNTKYNNVIDKICELEKMNINDMKKFKQNLSKNYHIPVAEPFVYKRFLDYLN